MGPHSQLPLRLLNDIPYQVVEADVVLAEIGKQFLNVIHIPGDRVEALAEPGLELANWRLLCTRDARQLHRLHDAVANGEPRGFSHSRLYVTPVEAAARENVVIPLIGGNQIVDDMGEVKQFADLEHESPPSLLYSTLVISPFFSAAAVRGPGWDGAGRAARLPLPPQC